MLKTEVLIAFLFLTRLYEFFEGGNEPVFGGRQFTQRIDRHATIGGKKLGVAQRYARSVFPSQQTRFMETSSFCHRLCFRFWPRFLSPLPHERCPIGNDCL